VADGLAYTAIPLGLVPAGTGNLLAPNLDLPLEEADAIEVALDGQYALLRDLDANITPGWNRSLPDRRRCNRLTLLNRSGHVVEIGGYDITSAYSPTRAMAYRTSSRRHRICPLP
jgi:hypothetical protein